MAKLKLSELPALTSRTSTDLLYVVQNGASKQMTVANLLSNVVTAGNNIVVESNGMISASTIENTDGLAEGNVNYYFSVARTLAAVKDSISTSNILEGSNLYFTNSRVIAALTAGAGITIQSNGMIVSDLEPFTSDNLNEGNNNLYFTNDRVVATLTAGSGIHIDANGMISTVSNIDGGEITDGVTSILDYGSL